MTTIGWYLVGIIVSGFVGSGFLALGIRDVETYQRIKYEDRKFGDTLYAVSWFPVALSLFILFGVYIYKIFDVK